jgi:hypothetical protein
LTRALRPWSRTEVVEGLQGRPEVRARIHAAARPPEELTECQLSAGAFGRVCRTIVPV